MLGIDLGKRCSGWEEMPWGRGAVNRATSSGSCGEQKGGENMTGFDTNSCITGPVKALWRWTYVTNDMQRKITIHWSWPTDLDLLILTHFLTPSTCNNHDPPRDQLKDHNIFHANNNFNGNLNHIRCINTLSQQLYCHRPRGNKCHEKASTTESCSQPGNLKL